MQNAVNGQIMKLSRLVFSGQSTGLLCLDKQGKRNIFLQNIVEKN